VPRLPPDAFDDAILEHAVARLPPGALADAILDDTVARLAAAAESSLVLPEPSRGFHDPAKYPEFDTQRVPDEIAQGIVDMDVPLDVVVEELTHVGPPAAKPIEVEPPLAAGSAAEPGEPQIPPAAPEQEPRLPSGPTPPTPVPAQKEVPPIGDDPRFKDWKAADFGIFDYVAKFMRLPEDVADVYELLVPALALERTNFAHPQEEPELVRRVEHAFQAMTAGLAGVPAAGPGSLTSERLCAHLRRLRRQHENLIHKRILALQRAEELDAFTESSADRRVGAGPELPDELWKKCIDEHFDAFTQTSAQQMMIERDRQQKVKVKNRQVTDRQQKTKDRQVKERLRGRFEAMLTEDFGGRSSLCVCSPCRRCRRRPHCLLWWGPRPRRLRV